MTPARVDREAGVGYRASVLALVRHACAALYPPTKSLPGVVDTGLDEFLPRFKRETTTLMWIGVVAGAVVFAVTPVLTVGVPLPAFLLWRGALDRHAHRIATHRLYLLRQAVTLVKLVAGLCWGGHPKVRALYGLPAYPDDPGTWRVQ